MDQDRFEKRAKDENLNRQHDSNLAAEAESAAAHDEPMGSIAAAVPGSNCLAEKAMETSQRPGAEETKIRDVPETTAGTEAKKEPERPAGRKRDAA